jgi:iron complex transport system permease protein
LLGLASFVGLGAGERWIDPISPVTHIDAVILWELRLPRVVAALAVGALLALSGAWLQVLLGNPLAEPYVLGIAGSASAGAILALALGAGSGWPASAGAFGGACVGIAALVPLRRLGPTRLLLAGVVLASFWGAFVTLLLALLPERQLGRAIGWMMGDLASVGLASAPLAVTAVAAVAAGIVLANPLDRLLLGETHAGMLGTPVERVRWIVLLLASAATAIAVTAAGTIGFVGLVVPHLVRAWWGPMHARLLPAAAIAGGVLLLLADTAARTWIAPAELPVGVITALIGVPVFVWLLARRAG